MKGIEFCKDIGIRKSEFVAKTLLTVWDSRGNETLLVFFSLSKEKDISRKRGGTR